MLTSFKNPKIKLIESLKKRKIREKERKFIVEGPHLVEEALRSEKLAYIIYSKAAFKGLLREVQKKNIESIEVAHKIIDKLSEVETPQGIIGVAQKLEFKLEDFLGQRESLIIFCHEIQDPGNLGTIIRTADAVAASGIILSKGTVDSYNSKVLRSSMGSIFHLPVVEVEKTEEAILKLKAEGIKVIATDLRAEMEHFEADYRRPLAILVGNEDRGLPENLLELADERVKIPMPGKAESLNAAMATSIILYEVLRQRRVHAG